MWTEGLPASLQAAVSKNLPLSSFPLGKDGEVSKGRAALC